MRKTLIILFLTLCSLAAHADYLYTVTVTGFGTPTAFSFTEPTISASGYVNSGFTQISGAVVTEFGWTSVAGDPCPLTAWHPSFPGYACAGETIEGLTGSLAGGFDPGSFLAIGTYAGTFMTVDISPTVPEPSSMMLLGSGLAGLFGVIRRRFNR